MLAPLLWCLALGLVGFPLPAASAVKNLPRFTTFGWLAPPPECTDSLHVDDYADAGLNVMLPAWRDSGLVADTQARLDLAEARGLTCIAWDRRLRQVNPEDPATFGVLDSIVARFADQPAFLAYYLGDEPAPARWPLMAGFFARLAERDPDHPGWNNLVGRGSFSSYEDFVGFLRQYVALVHPSILCNDHYDLLSGRDLGLQVENVRGIAEVARESGLPFWGIVLATPHRPFRAPGEGELRWQIGTWLSYGARGIGWFTYWTPDADTVYDWQPGLVDSAGRRSPLWEIARRVNRDARGVGVELAGAAWQRTQYAGSRPSRGDAFAPDDVIQGITGRACVAAFADSLGRDLRFVANSDSTGAQVVTLQLTPGRRTEQLEPATGRWHRIEACGSAAAAGLALALGPGEFTLLRFPRTPTGPALARRRLEARPNPARGTVDLIADGCAPGEILEIRDLAGRIVRTIPLPPEGVPATWRGERDDGAMARPGVYFVRVGSGARAATRRIVWSP
ncbi:MAG: hypothetical protein ABI960_08335 [Candidatus Eisenbacteria bacterium]